MSVSALSPIGALGSVSGLLQVASVFGLLLLLLKATQLYLHRQWLLKALQQFPSPPSHWLYGHSREVGRSRRGEWEGREGLALRSWSWEASSWDRALLYESTWLHVRTQFTSQALAPHPSLGSSLPYRSLCWCPRVCGALLP